MDSLAPSMDPIPPELSVQSSENTKRKRDTVDSVDGMYSCHVQLAVPLLHSLTEGLTLAHFPNFRKENKQVYYDL